MSTEDLNRSLLFGLLGLQTGLIARDQLLLAFGRWLEDKQHSLREILQQQGALGEDESQLLQGLVKTHLQKFDGDVNKSIDALSSIESVVGELSRMADGELHATLSLVANRKSTLVEETREPQGDSPITMEAGRPDGSQSSRFTIIRPHVRGGLGEVSLAQDQELNREVALKEIQSKYADDANSRSRFLLEAEITGRLEHPGIVPVYGLGQYADGRPYYAMRFIRGDSMGEAAERFHRKPSHAAAVDDQPPSATSTRLEKKFESLEFRKLLGRFVDVCNAIAYANARGILHRDLKPGNIMLGKYGETLVVDWGLAKPLGRSAQTAQVSGEQTLLPSSGSASAPTLLGSAIGTPAYMPPEQAAGDMEALGPASDVYSLGATLHFLLTGQAPVQGNSVAEVLDKVRAGDILSADKIEPHVPKPLAAICSRAMAKSPAARYATSQDLADEIERYLGDEPTLAYPESLVLKSRRWIRKHPRLVTSLAASLLVGLTSAVVIAAIVSSKNDQLNTANLRLAQANQEERQAREEAERERQAAELAKLQEQLAKEDAESRRQDTQAVLDFVSDRVLTTARPLGQDGGLGINVTVREAIDAATQHVQLDFEEQPVAEIVVRRTIGTTYFLLGEFKAAMEQHRLAVDLSREHLGESDETTLFCMNELAMASKYAGFQEEAFQLYEQILVAMKASSGDDHPDTLTYTNNLGEAYRAAGKVQLALPLLQDTLQRRKRVLGPKHPHTLTTMNNLALAIEDAGDRAKAIPLFEETLELRQAELGPEHPQSLQSINNLAAAYRADGQAERAIQLHQAALALLKEKIGVEHPDTLNCMNSLAMALHDAGQTQEALPIFEQVLQLRSKKLGANHPETFKSLTNLAFVLFSAEEAEKAQSLLAEYMYQRNALADLDPPRLAASLHTIVSLLFMNGHYAAAKGYLSQWSDVCSDESVARWMVPAAQGMLGIALAVEGEHALAEPLLLSGFADLEEWQAASPTEVIPHRRQFAHHLIELYTAQQRQEQVEVWRAKLNELSP